MRLIDVTRPIEEGMVTYPDEPGPELAPVKQIRDGDKANVEALRLGLHTGTHVDAPCHVLPGKGTTTSIPLESLCGPCRVIRIADRKEIRVDELERANLGGATRVLFRTRNSDERLWSSQKFREDYVALSPDAAAWLAARGVNLVGIDYLSIETFGRASPRAHANLLEKGCVIVEGLDLQGVEPGDYEVFALPLKVEESCGAPARVILRAASA